MPGPILFFVLIIVIDLILKSVKDKQKIEEVKNQRIPEINKVPKETRTLGELRKILQEELQKELSKKEDKTIDKKSIQANNKKEHKITKVDLERKKYYKETNNVDTVKTVKSMESLSEKNIEYKKEEIQKDILRGIIFSEILAPPKSVQNQKRSL
ncbi:hypothetical protein KQI41_11855 [Tissierella pigra]|uniref:Uncharacterized protein n=1 Tax=Tissierella pigra TaxID=2607614 RepID=A0A6N7XLC8_9FIRM|nr:hypothetical protein [Tissierella pigra]MBU5427109.1 hypothetical protein [Tissierella pigra]MSU02891.1 hypothetical protein [Tissierella pigra]